MKCCSAAPRLGLSSHRFLPWPPAASPGPDPHRPLFPPSAPFPGVCSAASAARPPAAASSSPRGFRHRHMAVAAGPPAAPDSAAEEAHEVDLFPSPSDGCSRRAAVAAAALGMLLAGIGIGGEEEAVALGPEGPLAEEEFWDNVRRYALYMVTVSTGAVYTVLQPVVELLKNPVSAILLLCILGGSFFLLSQVLSFMVGINDFSYDYAS